MLEYLFLEVYRAICLGNTVYNIYKLQNGEKKFTRIIHEYHVDIFLAPCNFHVESTLYQ